MSSKQNNQGRQDRLPWIAFGLVLVIATTISVAYFVAQRQEQRQKEERLAERRVVRGSTCAVLREASDALTNGDRDVLESSLKEAKSIAVEALNTTGVAFGQPEKEAIRLGNENLTSDEGLQQVEDRLATATESCSRIES
jgi:hypothetical protein